jgi:hypothetical protein
MGHVVHYDASDVRNINTLFFILLWYGYRFQKKCTRTHYAELLYLHPVGSVAQVVHCGASEARNVDALFFLLGWDRYGSHNNASGHLTPNLYFCIRCYLRVT